MDELTQGTQCAKDLVGRDNSGFTVKGLREYVQVITVITIMLVVRHLLITGMWSRSRHLGLETVSRCINVSSPSCLDKNLKCLGLVSVLGG